MNTIEFGSKTLLFYSLKKNERVDLSCLPDEVFDEEIHALWQTEVLEEFGLKRFFDVLNAICVEDLGFDFGNLLAAYGLQMWIRS